MVNSDSSAFSAQHLKDMMAVKADNITIGVLLNIVPGEAAAWAHHFHLLAIEGQCKHDLE